MNTLCASHPTVRMGVFRSLWAKQLFTRYPDHGPSGRCVSIPATREHLCLALADLVTGVCSSVTQLSGQISEAYQETFRALAGQ